jgi:hypothetical protein
VATLRSVDKAVNIADLRRLAKRRLPRIVFDYADGGADDEVTLRDNCRVFDTVALRPRNGVVAPLADLRTTVLGTTFDLPFLLAPIGGTRMFHPTAKRCHAAAAGGRRRLHPLDAVRFTARSEGAATGRVVPAVSWSADTRSRAPASARAPRADSRRWSSPSTRRSAACASAIIATAPANC